MKSCPHIWRDMTTSSTASAQSRYLMIMIVFAHKSDQKHQIVIVWLITIIRGTMIVMTIFSSILVTYDKLTYKETCWCRKMTWIFIFFYISKVNKVEWLKKEGIIEAQFLSNTSILWGCQFGSCLKLNSKSWQGTLYCLSESISFGEVTPSLCVKASMVISIFCSLYHVL